MSEEARKWMYRGGGAAAGVGLSEALAYMLGIKDVSARTAMGTLAAGAGGLAGEAFHDPGFIGAPVRPARNAPPPSPPSQASQMGEGLGSRALPLLGAGVATAVTSSALNRLDGPTKLAYRLLVNPRLRRRLAPKLIAKGGKLGAIGMVGLIAYNLLSDKKK